MQNFGKIKNIYNETLVDGIYKKDAEKKSIFQEYVKAINKSDILKTQFQVFKNIENKVEVDEYKATQYVKENIELLKKFNKKDIIEANQKLASGILFEQGVNFEYKLEGLHEEITKLIFTDKNANNIDKVLESLERVVDYIKNNGDKEELQENLIPTGILSDIAIEKFNDKYSDISEDEKRMLKSILDGDEDSKKDAFTSTIRECIDLVDGQLSESDLTTKEKMLKVKDKLLRMEYLEESFIADMGSVIELKNSLIDDADSE
jgi:hypothetical protein